jgi:amino acid transporter
MAAMVIVCSMVAVSFGSYATSLFIGDGAASWWDNLFTTALVVAMVAINMAGGTFVARAQTFIVALVLASFAFFVVVTLPSINLDLLAFDGYPPFSKIVASVALTFFAYMGFNVITFTAGDLRNPSHDLPRAMTGALGITGLTYVLIAIAVFGTLTVAQVVQYGPTAIAEAARPALGSFGFTLMAATAMLSTAGATNATLYASGNMTGMLAKVGLFPSFFGPGSRLGVKAGLLITGGVVLVVANFVDLSAIASVGSATALVLFLVICAAAFRLREQPRDHRAGDGGHGDRARRVLRRHAAERARDVRRDDPDRAARDRVRLRLAGEAPSRDGVKARELEIEDVWNVSSTLDEVAAALP